ncbi:hypothetical protein DE146DRAFT_753565 [Phaeosphaeria sp. MPI-PUGE-AT-0046c]|nr:hypothetical protein DE146DRAFT_753565 [Phaeosphaeria sp. MPI-PUGE-AT-0046c]
MSDFDPTSTCLEMANDGSFESDYDGNFESENHSQTSNYDNAMGHSQPTWSFFPKSDNSTASSTLVSVGSQAARIMTLEEKMFRQQQEIEGLRTALVQATANQVLPNLDLVAQGNLLSTVGVLQPHTPEHLGHMMRMATETSEAERYLHSVMEKADEINRESAIVKEENTMIKQKNVNMQVDISILEAKFNYINMEIEKVQVGSMHVNIGPKFELHNHIYGPSTGDALAYRPKKYDGKMLSIVETATRVPTVSRGDVGTSILVSVPSSAQRSASFLCGVRRKSRYPRLSIGFTGSQSKSSIGLQDFVALPIGTRLSLEAHGEYASGRHL